MRIGASLFLIALGAVLKWAVTYETSGVNINTVGTILLVVGGIGLLISLFLWASAGTRGRRTYVRDDIDPGL